MGLINLFKKKKQPETPADTGSAHSKEEIYKMLLEKMASRTPSEIFVSGSVFDLARVQRDTLQNILYSNNSAALLRWFQQMYSLFCQNPELIGISPSMVSIEKNDVILDEINADIIRLSDEDVVALCYMPVQSNKYSAGVIGIVISNKGDGYYYSMLDKNTNTPSDVMRNKAMQGIDMVGNVNGLGFDLINGFIDCIKNNFYST